MHGFYFYVLVEAAGQAITYGACVCVCPCVCVLEMDVERLWKGCSLFTVMVSTCKSMQCFYLPCQPGYQELPFMHL